MLQDDVRDEAREDEQPHDDGSPSDTEAGGRVMVAHDGSLLVVSLAGRKCLALSPEIREGRGVLTLRQLAGCLVWVS